MPNTKMSTKRMKLRSFLKTACWSHCQTIAGIPRCANLPWQFKMKSSTRTQEFGSKTLLASTMQSVSWKKQFLCRCDTHTFSREFWSRGRGFCCLVHPAQARRCSQRQLLLNAVPPFSMFLQALSCPSGEVTVRSWFGFYLNWQGTTSQALSLLMR
jgi:hypothetical protein